MFNHRLFAMTCPTHAPYLEKLTADNSPLNPKRLGSGKTAFKSFHLRRPELSLTDAKKLFAKQVISLGILAELSICFIFFFFDVCCFHLNNLVANNINGH